MAPLIEKEVPDQGPNNLEGLSAIFWHPMCTMLVAVPLGYAGHWLNWPTQARFWLNFVALVPLAKVLGDATEELAAGLGNDTVSGLLNATFGNAVEMIISVSSLNQGLIDIVKASLLGSVLSNILLVLGCSLLLGGLTTPKTLTHPAQEQEAGAAPVVKNYSVNSDYLGSFSKEDFDQKKNRCCTLEKEQKFGMKAAQVSLALLLLACMSFALPTVFNALPTDDEESVLTVSRIGAVVVGSSYIMFLLFTIVTHAKSLKKDEQNPGLPPQVAGLPVAADSLRATGAPPDEEDEEEGPAITVTCAISLMLVVTVIVSFTSDYLVDAIHELLETSSIPAGFIGVILLPIAGNACEHAGAVRFAMDDKPGLSIGIAVGSSTQVALLVVPFSVVVGWVVGQPMNLDFGVMNTAVMLLSVIVVQALLLDGRSNWLKGYMLCAAYVFIAVLYWFLPPQMGTED